MNSTSRLAPALGWSTLAFLLALGLHPISAADADTFAKSLKYTQDLVAKHHLIALVELEPLGKGKETKFRYDHYPNVERLQIDGATYARKKDQSWKKSEDWGETGSTVKPAKATELDALISFADAPVKNRTVSKDKAQGGNVVEFIKRDKQGDNDLLFYEIRREHSTNLFYPQFVFRPWKAGDEENAMLVGYAGLMRTGDEQLKVNINYQYMFLVDIVEDKGGQKADAKPEPTSPPEKTPPSEPEDRPSPKEPAKTPPEPKASSDAKADEPEGQAYDFMTLGREKGALSGKIVRVEISPTTTVARDLGDGTARVMVQDTGKPHPFIGLVDFPKDAYKQIGLADKSAKKNLTIYVRVKTTVEKGGAPYTAVGRHMAKGQNGEPAYEW